MSICNKWVFLLAWCGFSTQVQAVERWQLTFQWNGDSVQLLDAVSLGESGRATASTVIKPGQPLLQLRDRKGKVLSAQAMPDPRLVRVPMLPGQASSHQHVLREQGTFVVVTTAAPAALQVTLQWPETASSQGVVPALQQQISLQSAAAALQLEQ